MLVRKKSWLALVLVGLGAILLGTLPMTSQAAVLHRNGATTADWASWQGELSGDRFAPGTPVTPQNVSHLSESWAFTLPRITGTNPSSQPAVVGNTLYVGSNDAKFFALDATTGATVWSFDLTSVVGPVGSTPDPVRDGAAVSNGVVYFGDTRGYLYALNARTGALRWAIRVDPANPDVQETGSPTVYNGLVYIGTSNDENNFQETNLNYPCCTARGQVVAVSAATGAVAWRHYTVPAAQATGTWPSGATQYGPSGVSVWTTPVINPAAGLLYVGTGNNYTGSAGQADSVLALSLRTGKTAWSYQAQPDTYTTTCDDPALAPTYCPAQAAGNAHDWDMSSGNLYQAGGRTILGMGDKAGAYRAFDAVTGKLLWTQHLVANPSTEGGDGGIVWGGSTDGHRIYVATWFANPGVMYALNPATGAIEWQTPTPADGCTTGGAAGNPSCQLAFTPAVTSVPGLVFEGNADGKLYAFSSSTGQIAWQYDTVREFQGVNGVPGFGESLSGIGGVVVANGMLYVESGYYPLFASTEGTVLLAFKLSGS
ncbi:MAG TPA: PQQ-binding-like beta-propeller repeat protein [Trebonia sp.]|jgi:polyvinyl alcohol dehydrogenase (cytochrome)|nr:PQQ-binding-like beta-propeller repeat protein [Trebonia sp.]